tara:strand:- start:190 stop:696 length:507 start_codon:yes stop_codon:yes gene_type:complete
MVYQKKLLLVFACLVISSCNLTEYKQFKIDNKKYYFTFNQNIPSSFQEKVITKLGHNSDDMSNKKTEVQIIKYELKTSSIYSGSALRALEKEIKASISFNIVGSNSMNMDHSMHMNQSMNIKTVNIMKRFSAIELNPMAENAMIQFMENQVINDLIDQLILEVSLVDL